MIDVVKRGAGLGLKTAGALAFLAPLLTRLVMGQAFHQTGTGKLANLSNTVQYFTTLGIPMPELNAAFVARVEYYGGILLILGLLTRLAAALLGSTMIVALLTADRVDFVSALMGSGEKGLTDVVPVVYGLFLLWLVLFGPGALSLDALVKRWLGLGHGKAADVRPLAAST
jgi:putative oxidoreductase